MIKSLFIVQILRMVKTLPLKILTAGIRNAAGNAADTIMSSDWTERLKTDVLWLRSALIAKVIMKTALAFA